MELTPTTQKKLIIAREAVGAWSVWAARVGQRAGWVGRFAKAGRIAGTAVGVADVALEVYHTVHIDDDALRREAWQRVVVNALVLTGATLTGGWMGAGLYAAGALHAAQTQPPHEVVALQVDSENKDAPEKELPAPQSDPPSQPQ